MQMQAAPLQGITQVACGVRGEQYDGRYQRSDGADFRHGHLIVGEDFQQKSFELLIRLVDLVDQQHRAARLFQCA